MLNQMQLDVEFALELIHGSDRISNRGKLIFDHATHTAAHMKYLADQGATDRVPLEYCNESAQVVIDELLRCLQRPEFRLPNGKPERGTHSQVCTRHRLAL